jgi:hypothetical protein
MLRDQSFGSVGSNSYAVTGVMLCSKQAKPSQVRTVLRSANTVTKKLKLQPLRKYRKGVIG